MTESEAPECMCCDGRMQILHEDMFDDRYGCEGRYRIYVCKGCGYARTWPSLREEELPGLYEKYYPRSRVRPEDVGKAAQNFGDVKTRIRLWWEGVDNQGQYLARPGMRVLDYGCGNGTSLIEAAMLGADAYGIEADPNVDRIAKELGLRIHIGSMDDMPFGDEKFDLIVLNQVLEHVPDPCGLMEKIRGHLREKGRVAVSVPNRASLNAKLFGRQWINWHIPYHQHHFTRTSLSSFLERQGFDVHRKRTITPNLWTILQMRHASVCAVYGKKNPIWVSETEAEALGEKKPSRLLDMATRLQGLRLSRFFLSSINRCIDAVGLGDSIFVLARKR